MTFEQNSRFEPSRDQLTGGAIEYLFKFMEETNEDFMRDCLLTKTENKVIALMAEGNDVQQTADKLGVAECTVNTHIRSIYSKYNLTGGFMAMKAVVRYLERTHRLKDE